MKATVQQKPKLWVKVKPELGSLKQRRLGGPGDLEKSQCNATDVCGTSILGEEEDGICCRRACGTNFHENMCPGCREPFGSGEKPQLACRVTGRGAGQTCGFESEQRPYPKLWPPHLRNGVGEVYPSVPWRMTEPRSQNMPTLACSRVSLPLCCQENVPLTSGGQGSRQKSYWFSALCTLLHFRFPFADKALKKNFPLRRRMPIVMVPPPFFPIYHLKH